MDDDFVPRTIDDDAGRRAAIELARQKVLASFSSAPANYVPVDEPKREVADASGVALAAPEVRQPLVSNHDKRMEKIRGLLEGRAKRLEAESGLSKVWKGIRKRNEAWRAGIGERLAERRRKSADGEVAGDFGIVDHTDSGLAAGDGGYVGVVAGGASGGASGEIYERTMGEAGGELRVSEQEWRKFHSAWQDYYQKYYENYYTTALRRAQAEAKLAKGAEKRTAVSRAKRLELEERLRAEDEAAAAEVEELQKKIQKRASDSAATIRRSRHFVPIVAGVAVVLVFLFLQYNRLVMGTVRAFVSPGAGMASEVVELNPTVPVNIGPEPLLIIPRINVEVPIVTGVGWDHESQQAAMDHGVAHFSIPGANAMPGEIGNFVLSGHSSGSVLDRGSYKFIFAQLPRLEAGDTIHVNYGGVRFSYVVTRTAVVHPTDVQSIVFETTTPMLTLITCYPIGTARDRWLVFAEQVSPNPLDAPVSGEWEGGEAPVVVAMPDSAPSFFGRVWSFLRGRGW